MSNSKRLKIKKPVTKGVASVPVVMQMEALECGAASLSMVMAYYGLWLPLEQVRFDCGVSRDGSSAKNVLVAARNYGFSAKGYRIEPEDLKTEGIFPCIVHWEFNHFIVVKGFKGDKVYVNDPARGSVIMPMQRFDEGFTGICLMFEPTEDFKPQGQRVSMFKYAWQQLKEAKGAFAFVCITTAVVSLLSLISAGISRVFLDRILGGDNQAWLVPVLIAMAAVLIIQTIMEFIKAKYSLQIDGKMSIVGSTRYMWRILRLPMEFFSQRMAGDIQSRMADTSMIASSIINTLAPLVLDTIMMVVYLVVMLRYSIVLTMVGIASIAINSFAAAYIAKERVNITRVIMRDEGKLYGTTVSGIEMIETIKASGAENGFFEKWSGYQASVNSQKVRFSKVHNYLGMLPLAISEVMSALVVLLGVWFVINGEFTVGMVLAFQTFLTSFMQPANSLIEVGSSLQELGAKMERVNDVMKYPVAVSDEAEDEPLSYEKLKGNIEMKNITFGYSRLGEPVVRDFNLTLKPGSRVAFVGSSGCGKSTLSKLISGLYKPWEGEILFDGKKIEDIDRNVFTGSLAVVDQDIILFEDTLASNIKMWDSTIEDFEMILAARDAQMHDEIMKRDGGYNYKLIEGGKDFSGGQRQRLEIARVLAQDPTIIILDEATSALDAKTEFDVVKSITDRGITCIVVAHRLSTIRDCDEIIVLDKGVVVERGTHDELYANGGYYTQLVSNE